MFFKVPHKLGQRRHAGALCDTEPPLIAKLPPIRRTQRVGQRRRLELHELRLDAFKLVGVVGDGGRGGGGGRGGVGGGGVAAAAAAALSIVARESRCA